MIILTGASGGIGQQLVPYLCKVDDVLGIYHASKPEPRDGDTATYEQLDIEDANAIRCFADHWRNRMFNITLVHCAGINVSGLMVNYKLSDWDKLLSVNLRANFILSQAFLPSMIRDSWGRIVHISSKGGIEGMPGTVAYATAKTGLIGLSRVIANEYRRYNITSNVLALGTFKTGMFLDLTEQEQKTADEYIGHGNVEDIANAIASLINSQEKSGTVINVGNDR